MKPMHDSGAVPAVKFVEVQTGLAQVQAMVNLSRKNLNDARLLAPVDGFVVKKNLEVGQSVTPGMTVLTLVNPRYLDAVFAVPETEVLHVRMGMPVQALLEKPDGSRYVYVVENGKASAHAVQIGGFWGKGLRVLAGLKKSDHVIVEGSHGQCTIGKSQ